MKVSTRWKLHSICYKNRPSITAAWYSVVFTITLSWVGPHKKHTRNSYAILPNAMSVYLLLSRLYHYLLRKLSSNFRYFRSRSNSSCTRLSLSLSSFIVELTTDSCLSFSDCLRLSPNVCSSRLVCSSSIFRILWVRSNSEVTVVWKQCSVNNHQNNWNWDHSPISCFNSPWSQTSLVLLSWPLQRSSLVLSDIKQTFSLIFRILSKFASKLHFSPNSRAI